MFKSVLRDSEVDSGSRHGKTMRERWAAGVAAFSTVSLLGTLGIFVLFLDIRNCQCFEDLSPLVLDLTSFPEHSRRSGDCSAVNATKTTK